ncbi:MAG: biotin transporter BioY, partial [Actinomycetia bacterium]|nr:biotin transporter BioY [Actinomycetes bacterium]
MKNIFKIFLTDRITERTFSETIREERENIVLKLAGAVVFALLTALSSKVRIFLPVTPVPVTLQVLVVLFSGFFLGPFYGALSQIFYISLGGLGLSVFTVSLFGVTGGYIIGFIFAAWFIGFSMRYLN